ncbi:MAG: hypothetical protein ACLR6Z_06525 [Dorea sp.]
MKKRTLTVLVVALVCTFLTACSKEIDTMTESVNEKESSVIENPTVLEDTTEIVFPEQFEALSGYDEEALVDYLKENSDGNYQKIECIDGQVNMVATQEEIEYWKGYVEKHIDDQKAVLTGINQKYDVCCNDSYNTINMYYDQELSFKKAFSCVGKTSIYCAMYQILDGNALVCTFLTACSTEMNTMTESVNEKNRESSSNGGDLQF